VKAARVISLISRILSTCRSFEPHTVNLFAFATIVQKYGWGYMTNT
jgi:hypothetical protein